ncbi:MULTISPECIES: MFS transporter [Achromobacter]|jgi:MFS family permease|uniref:Inner membrane metabolite transport protein YhjE n=1 Tax=Achromobacter kerstersii TaxID=1353890 RepID=A0A6S7BCD6_9BURK|nr:MFS transporter [Achromobacter kerstersii]CAB3707787.1 Inner membrane metabolite transport protein YhjE [Achromobacter kerstersii]CUI89178.1 Inner membrane metabolite transport protein yhjE [Achromobacter kerstersii]
MSTTTRYPGHTPSVPGPGATAGGASHAKVAPGEIAVGVVVGRASEYFDFFVFGIACVLVFPKVFFPFEAPLEGTLWAFVIFSFAFIMRPIGTALSMAIQRRWGRATKLTVALFVLGTATVGMAFLPSYESIGAHAITLLAVFRCLQGLAFGGSWDGLPSLLALNAPPNRRGWYSMMGQLGAPVGFLVASALFLYLHVTLTQADFLEWGWRYPFFVAFAINVVALFARLRLVVTEEYTQLLEEGELEPISIAEMVRSQGYNLFIGAFAALASYALFHLVTVFPLSWIAISATQQITDVLIVQIFGAILGILGTVASGWLADRIGRRTTLGLLAVLIGIFALFTPWLLGGGPVGQDAFILVGFTLLGLSYGQASGTVTANFTRRFRYTGAALTSDMAWLVGAAFAPVVALGLSARFGLVAVSIYLLSGTACTLIALRINKVLETRD